VFKKNKKLVFDHMKKLLLFACLICLFSVELNAQSVMSDTQVMQFIQNEARSGTSRSQIVIKLMQRGVNMDQIQRVRNQYEKQLQKTDTGVNAQARTVDFDDSNVSSSSTNYQEVVTGKIGTATQVEENASDVQQRVENDVMTASVASEETFGKKIFGHDIFNRRLLSFEPNMNLATPSRYVLGPGDVVVVEIYGASQKSMELTVSPEGEITVPGYGPIHVSGLSVESANARIRSTLGSRYSSSNIKMSVNRSRTIMVHVMGEVKAPGTYRLSGYATVFHALYMAGGIADLGTLRNIKVSRGGRIISVVDVYEFILNGRLAGNVSLQDDDVIQVGTYDCIVGITGNVKRPMFYEMRKNETVSTLLKYAGGFTGDAYTKSVRVQRSTGERHSVHNVEEFDMSVFKVADGDNVTVDGILDRYENVVEIKGAVFRPGQFQLGEGVFSVRSLVEHAEGLTEDAFPEHAIIHRLKPDRTLEVISVDVAGIMSEAIPDVPLKNEDVLFIPTNSEMVKERTLTITGAVMSPGTYEYADNVTIEDLIVQAGGLRDNASLARVDVSRRILDPMATEKTDKIAESFSFDIKDGLVINNDRQFHLQPYDVVHVRMSPAFSTARTITVTGEVNYEGNFTLENKSMRLSDAIKLAGGATNAAYLRGARLTRRMNDEERVRMRATMEAVRNLLTDRNDSLAWNKMELENTYPIGIQLDEAINNPGSDKDILLREGDQIFVPEYNGSVKVSGNVMFPNTIFFEKGQNAKFYIKQAGGYGNRAKKSKTFIVYQNGTVGIAKKGAMPEPGCEIVVPSKKYREPFSLRDLTNVTTPLTTIAMLIVALSRL
jgi:protein involved in polysaccharide export with SLBB domain